MTLIRIDLGPEVDGSRPGGGRRHGKFRYSCGAPYWSVGGFSRQPLLDACRQLKTRYGLSPERVGLFREGSDVADISCSVEAGAATTVADRDKGTIKFEVYRDLARVHRSKVQVTSWKPVAPM